MKGSDKFRTERRPDLICIGPKRSATTWLADQLKFHRDIWLPPIQELSYLSGDFSAHRDKPYMSLRWTGWEVAKRVIRNKGPGIGADRRFLRVARRLAADPTVDLLKYRELFAPAGARLSVDISPMYASMTALQIANALPALSEACVVLLARDPVARFWSELSMHARKRTFGTADCGSIEIAQAFFNDSERQKQHLLSGIVERWRAGLGVDRVNILFFDDIMTMPEIALRRIVAMIGADWSKRLPGLSPAWNRKQGSTALSPAPEVQAAVAGWFAGELDRCVGLLGPNAAAWRERHLR